jgi:hypothetical protein
MFNFFSQIHFLKVQKSTVEPYGARKYSQQTSHSKVVLLMIITILSVYSFNTFSLRCQSHIYLKLYKINHHEVKELQHVTNNYKPNLTEVTNGNTPSPLSPTSVGSQVRSSGSVSKYFLSIERF